jgi:hypothetical protein
MGHANRSKRNLTAKANPPATMVREARAAAGHDERQAAATIYVTETRWRQWEQEQAESRAMMHPAFYELYLLKTGQKTVDQVLDEAAEQALQAQGDV